jgi:hypothetical protein
MQLSGLASSEISHDKRLVQGTHLAYVFSDSSEKQSTLFHFSEKAVGSENSYLLYIAGKQGVKGIRLSLKDVRFDVALYEKARQLRIVDSDDWYLLSGKLHGYFKSNEQLRDQLTSVISEASAAGYPFVTVISETDSLVRKGFYGKYSEFDLFLGRTISDLPAAFVCAFDRRELEAAGVRNIREDLSKSHSEIV